MKRRFFLGGVVTTAAVGAAETVGGHQPLSTSYKLAVGCRLPATFGFRLFQMV